MYEIQIFQYTPFGKYQPQANSFSAQKPLPKLPYKFSTFPAPNPPRSPLLKAPIIQSLKINTELANTAPVVPHYPGKIVPFKELNRRLDGDPRPGLLTKPRKNSASGRGQGPNPHKRTRSGTTVRPPSNAPSTPSRAKVSTAEVAINGFGMKSRLISVKRGGNGIGVTTGKRTSGVFKKTSKRRGVSRKPKVVRMSRSDENIVMGHVKKEGLRRTMTAPLDQSPRMV